MKTIAHISDLHFGRVDDAILPGLRRALQNAGPDVVVVSGDLTQRARRREFMAARAFLDSLPQPQIVVPGNHDIPLYNILARWLRPLSRFQRYVTPELAPFYADDEISVAGVNSARSLTFKNGRLNASQIEASCRKMTDHPHAKMRVLVTHHPFDILDGGSQSDIVGRSELAIAQFRRCNIDIIMSGHLHASHTGTSAVRYGGAGSILFVQAGTATSVRKRGEVNAWNLVRIAEDRVCVERMGWDADSGDFALSQTESFTRTKDGWTASSQGETAVK